MEKRILLAVSLSFIVLVVYQSYFLPPPVNQPASVAGEADEVEPAGVLSSDAPAPGSPDTTAALAPPAAAPRPDAGADASALIEPSRDPATDPSPDPATDRAGEDAPTEPRAPAVAGSSQRDVVAEMPRVTAVFSNRGAVLKSWRLNDYRDDDGEPLELVPPALPGSPPKPFTIAFDDPELTATLSSALFRATTTGFDSSADGGTIAFDYDDGAGLTASKTFSIDPAEPFVIRFSASVRRDGQVLTPVIRWGPGLSDTTSASGWIAEARGIHLLDDSPERLDPDDIAEQPIAEGAFTFVGIDDHYFLSAALPEGPVRVGYGSVSRPADDSDTVARTFVSYDLQTQQPPRDLEFFVGPKDFDVLERVHGELVRAIDFGFFAFLAVPLLRALKWINAFVGNYGWSIIILTILINAAMFPLRHKSVASMRKMQEIQPEVKAIQERYSKLKTTDPARQKMNSELMNLYRQRGVNPASGCFPMLLTMPVLFAFYSLLSVAIEIRGAPFVLWITDLSAHDPLYITPVIMGLTMVWQQMRTPTTADPMQQKIMMVMPIMFTFMFLWASSGLVLYWLMSNVFAIGQQEITNRIIGPPVVKAVRPPAERKVRPERRGKKASRAKPSAAKS